MAKINWKNKDEVNSYRRAYRKEHAEDFNKKGKEWRDRNPKKRRDIWSRVMFDGKKQDVLERDNFECQECGISQEQHIILFNRHLSIHHIDEKGANVDSESKNNDIDNLITLCMRCHKKLHIRIVMQERYGDYLEQDDSKWRFPKLRELVQDKAEEVGTIGEAKKIVGEMFGVTYDSIDGKYYEKKVSIIKRKGKKNGR